MFQKIAKGLSVDATLAELNANPVLWQLFTLRQSVEGTPHKDTECIVIRGPAIPDIDSAFNDLVAHDYPVVHGLHETVKLIGEVYQNYLTEYFLGRVMIAKLKPGGHITAHADEGAYAEYYERFHLVLSSKDGNRFRNEMAMVIMKPGDLWMFEHRLEHEVWNKSAEDRIHIIIDARKKEEVAHG